MIKILYSPYAIEVYSDSGDFAGGITRRRMESGDMTPYVIAEALQAILDGLGLAATLVDDTAAVPGLTKVANTPRPS